MYSNSIQNIEDLFGSFWIKHPVHSCSITIHWDLTVHRCQATRVSKRFVHRTSPWSLQDLLLLIEVYMGIIWGLYGIIRIVMGYGCVWKWLVPLNPMVLLIMKSLLNGYFIGNIPYFQKNPYWGLAYAYSIRSHWHLHDHGAVYAPPGSHGMTGLRTGVSGGPKKTDATHSISCAPQPCGSHNSRRAPASAKAHGRTFSRMWGFFMAEERNHKKKTAVLMVWINLKK